MINICRKAFFYEQLKLEKITFFEVPLSPHDQCGGLPVAGGKLLLHYTIMLEDP